MEIILILTLVAVAFYLGVKFERSNTTYQLVLLVNVILKLDKKLAISGKGIKDYSFAELMREIDKQLRLELC